MKNDTRITMLADHIDSVFHGKAWHGGAFIPTIRQIDAEHAITKNSEGYSPWAVLLHSAYWKFVARKKISVDGESLKFGREGEDFPNLPVQKNDGTWEEDIAFVEEEHRLLREAVLAFSPERLDEQVPGSQFSYAGLILGVASHDAYHTAMIRNLGVFQFLHE